MNTDPQQPARPASGTSSEQSGARPAAASGPPPSPRAPVAGSTASTPAWSRGRTWSGEPEGDIDRPERHHGLIAWVVALIVVAAAIAGLVVYNQPANNGAAAAKADKVISLFRIHGIPVPVDRRTVISVLGDNGGPVCTAPGSALNQALKDQQLSNGAATVGIRPNRVDRRYVAGEYLVLQVYCPQKLPAFIRYVNGRRYYNVGI